MISSYHALVTFFAFFCNRLVNLFHVFVNAILQLRAGQLLPLLCAYARQIITRVITRAERGTPSDEDARRIKKPVGGNLPADGRTKRTTQKKRKKKRRQAPPFPPFAFPHKRRRFFRLGTERKRPAHSRRAEIFYIIINTEPKIIVEIFLIFFTNIFFVRSKRPDQEP